LFIWKGKQANQYRAPVTIKVSPATIDINGKAVPTSELHRLILRNHVDGTEVFGGVQQYGGGVSAGLQNAGAALGQHLEKKRIQKLAEISYRLDAEHGGKATTLAGGLNETTAYGLMTDVSNILGLSVR
jgi:hypothetical protein